MKIKGKIENTHSLEKFLLSNFDLIFEIMKVSSSGIKSCDSQIEKFTKLYFILLVCPAYVDEPIELLYHLRVRDVIWNDDHVILKNYNSDKSTTFTEIILDGESHYNFSKLFGENAFNSKSDRRVFHKLNNKTIVRNKLKLEIKKIQKLCSSDHSQACLEHEIQTCFTVFEDPCLFRTLNSNSQI